MNFGFDNGVKKRGGTYWLINIGNMDNIYLLSRVGRIIEDIYVGYERVVVNWSVGFGNRCRRDLRVKLDLRLQNDWGKL